MGLSFALWLLAAAPDAAARITPRRRPAPHTPRRSRTSPGPDAASAAFAATLRRRPPLWLFGREATRDAAWAAG
jgi:cytochrome P450